MTSPCKSFGSSPYKAPKLASVGEEFLVEKRYTKHCELATSLDKSPCKSFGFSPYKVPELASVGEKFPVGKRYTDFFVPLNLV